MRSAATLLIKLPSYYLFRWFGYPKLLPFNYTFLISTRCNSRCKTCNIWKEKGKELDLKEWEKIFLSLGKSPFWVTISGGEPFLQKHLVSMVFLLDKICQPAIINIPTNSLLGEKVSLDVEKILQKITQAKLVINLSLDGVGKDHDEVRGIQGNFDKVMANYQNLKKLQQKHPNLIVGFGTVISKFNFKKIKKVADLAFNLEPDQYVSEIAEERVELLTVGKKITPSLKEYSEAINCLVNKMEGYKFSGLGRISRAFRFAYYQFVKSYLQGKKLLPDFAGFVSCEITSQGIVWPSCIKGEEMGDLKRVGFNFRKAWFSSQAKKVRDKIKKEGTSYPLANAFYSSVLFHPPTLFKVLRRLF